MLSAAKSRPILHDDWSIRLGENRPDQNSQTFGSYATQPASIIGKLIILFKNLIIDILIDQTKNNYCDAKTLALSLDRYAVNYNYYANLFLHLQKYGHCSRFLEIAQLK